MQSEIEKIRSWKAPEDKEDPALEFPPPDEPAPAAKAQTQAKPKAKKQPTPKPKGKSKSEKTGWFIETYPIVERDGKSVVDLAGLESYGPIQTTNLAGAMKSFKALAEKSPEAVNHHSVRVVKVEKVFSTKVKQVVEIAE